MRPAAPLVLLALLSGPATATTLQVDVQGIQSYEGQLKVALCQQTLDEVGCRSGSARPPKAAVETFTFTDIVPGRYAVIGYHDLNGNDQLDLGLFGIPAEPYGLSNDVGRFGPPSFDAAAVDVGPAGARVGLRVATPLSLR